MGNLQRYNTYVGARYVPVIDGDWDISKEYEPLTVVTYQGNSYTSRTFVPSNTPITNEDYWALTGNYNAQVEAYRQAVSALSDEINGGLKQSNLKVSDFEQPSLFTHDGIMLNNRIALSGLELGDYTILQGGCIVNNHYILCLTSSLNDDTGILVEINGGTLVRKSDPITVYHGNDITYNPDNDSLYITTLTAAIVIVSYTEFAVLDTVTLEHQINNIAYSPITKKFYGNSGTDIYVFDASLNLEKNFNPHFRGNNLYGLSGYNGQGLAVYDNRLIMSANAVVNDRYIYHVLLIVNIDTEEFICRLLYPNELPSIELESIDFNSNGVLFGFCGHSSIHVYTFEYNGNIPIENLNSPKVLTPITESSYNIDRMLREGNIYEYGSGSFTNVPTKGLSGKLTLKSIAGGDNYFTQKLTDKEGHEYRRGYDDSGNTTAWLGLALAGSNGFIDTGVSVLRFYNVNIAFNDLTLMSNTPPRYSYITDISASDLGYAHIIVTPQDCDISCYGKVSGGKIAIILNPTGSTYTSGESLVFKIAVIGTRP